MNANQGWGPQRIYPAHNPKQRLPVAPGMPPDQKKWVQAKWAAIRKAQQKADEANNNWSQVNDGINEWLTGMQITDPVQRAKIKGESLELKDALSTGSWHARNAERHIHDLQLYLKLIEMGLLP